MIFTLGVDCGDARPDGRPHRRLRAAHRGDAADALARRRQARSASRSRSSSGSPSRSSSPPSSPRTGFGRAIYATGTREGAAYLSGIRTRLVIVGAFVVSGVCAAIAGVLLAGYSTKAYQGMGNAYLLPAIAAVVLGGTRILGGSGRYIGTVVGVILIVLLNSVLSIMQMPEAGRQIIYGAVIVGMLLVYGRNEKITS